MTFYQSRKGDLDSNGVQVHDGALTLPRDNPSLFMIQLLTEISNQTIILKRINSKLWKLCDMLSKEEASLAQFDNTPGDQ